MTDPPTRPSASFAAEPAPPGSPIRPVPDQPRLGIIHLMVWTACVAVFFSVARTTLADNWAELGTAKLVHWLTYGVGAGTALSGLLLWVARRRRGLPFPGQPGETLLVLLGVGALVNLGHFPILALTTSLEELDDSYTAWWWQNALYHTLWFLKTLILGAFYLRAAIRTNVTRWRVYLTLVVASSILSFTVSLAQGYLSLYGQPMVWLWLIQGIYLLPRAVLVVVVIGDALQSDGYRWTHWLGAGIDLWFAASTAMWLLWTTLVPEPSF